MATPAVDLGPAPLDLKGVRAGDENAIEFTLHHGPDPVDLTGQVVAAQARKTSTDPTAISATVVIDSDPTTGKFTLAWSGDDVRALLDDNDTWAGVWDLQLGPDPDGTTVVAGKIGLKMDVTREG